jgi:hypothetical protein
MPSECMFCCGYDNYMCTYTQISGGRLAHEYVASCPISSRLNLNALWSQVENWTFHFWLDVRVTEGDVMDECVHLSALSIRLEKLLKEVCSSGEEHSIGHKQVIGSNPSVKVTDKVVPVLNKLSAMQWRHMRKWRYSSTILDLDTWWRWVVSFTPMPLYPHGKSPSTHWIGGRVDPRVGLDDVEKSKFLTLPGLELRPLSSTP